jgi:hypothetical protein
MLSQSLIYDEKGKVFSVQILAGRSRRLKDNGVMLYAKTVTSANE